ncbi:MAG: hypothetical protein U0O18_03445, partial [Clostridia bacterium]
LMLNFDHFVHTFPPILKILENPYMVFYGFSRIQGRHGWFTGYRNTDYLKDSIGCLKNREITLILKG